jgi:hypothetical protein
LRHGRQVLERAVADGRQHIGVKVIAVIHARVYAFLLSTAVIFVAELVDKSQLMAMTFAAARYRVRDVLIGMTAATALVHLASVGIGYWIGDAFAEQQHWISIAAARSEGAREPGLVAVNPAVAARGFMRAPC